MTWRSKTYHRLNQLQQRQQQHRKQQPTRQDRQVFLLLQLTFCFWSLVRVDALLG